MLQCPKCKKSFSEKYAFCEECGVRLISLSSQVTRQPKDLVFDRAEKFILFRITRFYTWAILILSVLGFIGAIIYLAPDIRPFILKDTSVSVTEVKKVFDAKKAGKGPTEGESSPRALDPELLSKFDKEIYELIQLLPQKTQDDAGVERLRGWIRDRIGHYSTIKEKTNVLREAKKILAKFSEHERGEVLGIFFSIKVDKEKAHVLGETEAKIKLATIGGTLFALIMTIAAFSFILVLLAIERNTRKG